MFSSKVRFSFIVEAGMYHSDIRVNILHTVKVLGRVAY